MRPTTVVLILVILIAATAAIFVENHRAEAHSGYARVNGGDGLRLREGPGAEYRIITVMPHNSRVKFMGHRGNWAKVRYLATGQVGWTWLAYLVPESGTTSGGGGGDSGAGYCMTTYWHEYVCASANTANAIRYWFGQYGISAWWGFAVASCESNFNPYAYNPASGVTGLFQFQPSTFYWQGGHNLYDVWDQSRIAAKMMASGLGAHFYCATLQGW
jgi:hypothetical protein